MSKNIKNTTYQEKFALLSPWFELIVASVKKDLKNEQLKKDRAIYFQLFGNKPIQKLTTEEMVGAYARAIASGNEALGEYLAARWILKHTDLYGFFEERLRRISPQFDEIEELEAATAEALLEEACAAFDATTTYLFSVLNAVVFPPAAFDKLRKAAQDESSAAEKRAKEEALFGDASSVKLHYETRLSRQEDRYEKRLAGWERKYDQDIAMLKKQVGSLQKKLQEGSVTCV